MEKYLEEVRDDMINGYGFILFQGMPVKEWGMRKSSTAYMGLGAHFGHIVSQNGRGHVLGHIKDLGENPADFHKVRLYRTTARYVTRDPARQLDSLIFQTNLPCGPGRYCRTAMPQYSAERRREQHRFRPSGLERYARGAP